MATTYKIWAAHVSERFRLRDLRDKFAHPMEDFSNYEMVIRYGGDSYAFVYNYGSVVFFNVPEELRVTELARIRETKEGAKIGDTTEVFSVEIMEVEQSGPNQVYYDRVVLQQLTYQKAKIISMLVAESAALEYYEILIENLLERATHYTKKLETEGKFLDSNEDILKFVGQCLSTKQEIISNMYIVDSPDETWESAEVDKLHHDLKLMFEVDVRYRALEYKSKIIQESLEVISDLAKSKRELMLELIVILLIAFEVVMNFFGH